MKAQLIAVGGCVLLLSGCGGNSDEAAPEASAQSTTSASASASSTAADGNGGDAGQPATVTQTPPIDCTVGQLSTAIDSDGSGAEAGSTSFMITFTNTSGTACKLTGFPGVSYTAGPYSYQVGAAASRTGDMLGTVPLQPGETAAATVVAVNVTNYPAQECGPVPVPGIHVYPPNSYEAVYLAYEATACSVPTAQQLSVTSVSVPRN